MRRENLKAEICSLCFNTKFDVQFKVVEIIKEVLKIVLPKLNLEEGDKHLICSSCSVKLFAAFNFKSVCTDTEDTIFPYVTSQEMPLVDLRKIYLREKGDIQLSDILGDQKICRLCFQSVGYSFVSLNEVDVDIIENYIPEVNFSATKDPVICTVCSDSLVAHGTFLSSCLAAQEENRKVCGDLAEERECCIKIEEIKIEDDWERDPPPRLKNVEMIKNLEGRHSSNAVRKTRTYTCNRCDFKTSYRENLKKHCLKHVSLTSTYTTPKSQCKSESTTSSPSPLRCQERMYQCEKCPYRTHLREIFARHWSTHEVPSEATVYRCEECHYRTTRKDHFRRHKSTHENGGKEQTFSCNLCDFQSKYKRNMFRHQLKHETRKWKDVKYNMTGDGELTYKCNVCKYEAKYKSKVLAHRCRHVSPSEQPIFKCHVCRFKSFDEDKWMKHQSKHSSGAKTFRCDVCFFQTVWKNNLIRHQLCHRNIGEVKTYECDKCGYKSKYKDSLKRHELLHNVLE